MRRSLSLVLALSSGAALAACGDDLPRPALPHWPNEAAIETWMVQQVRQLAALGDDRELFVAGRDLMLRFGVVLRGEVGGSTLVEEGLRIGRPTSVLPNWVFLRAGEPAEWLPDATFVRLIRADGLFVPGPGELPEDALLFIGFGQQRAAVLDLARETVLFLPADRGLPRHEFAPLDERWCRQAVEHIVDLRGNDFGRACGELLVRFGAPVKYFGLQERLHDYAVRPPARGQRTWVFDGGGPARDDVSGQAMRPAKPSVIVPDMRFLRVIDAQGVREVDGTPCGTDSHLVIGLGAGRCVLVSLAAATVSFVPPLREE